jgi:hypothetical protein
MAGLSLLRVVSNSELVQQEQQAAEAELAARQSSELILGISGYLRLCWDAAKRAKTDIETKMLKAMRQRNGEYEPDKLAAINKQGGSTVYMMITEVKCRAAESWLRDIMLDTGSPPWDIQATPLPDLSPDQMSEIQSIFADAVANILQNSKQAPPPEAMRALKEVIAQDYRFTLLQEASNRVDRMKFKIADQFAQGGLDRAFSDFITDLVTFPAAILKGPVVRRQKTLGWTKDATGRTVAAPTERIVPEYERVDPFRFYPEPGITDIDEGYCFEHHPMSRMQLSELIGVPGYDDAAIRKVLEIGPGASWLRSSFETEKANAENKSPHVDRPTQMYDALEFWGEVSGRMLREWGLTEEEVPDQAKEYCANVWLVGDFCIRAVLNYDPLGKKPYRKTSFIKAPGALWGKGIPEIIEDIQGVCNAAARSLVNNMGISSGPQVEVNLERIPANEDITQIFPWKIWQVTNDPYGSSAPAIRFTQPVDNSNALVAVYEKFSRLADDHSGIPAYLYGDLNVQGAGRTSSGLSMLMGSAGKGIRQVVMHIDSDVIKPVVEAQYIYNMRYDEDESIKGDVDIMPRGAVNLATKETMNTRRIEFLNATANPIDMEIMGKSGREVVLREIAKGLQMPEDEVVPSREKAMLKGDAPAPQPQAGMTPPGQQPAPTPTDPSGAPMGGMEGNTVMNRGTGTSG